MDINEAVQAPSFGRHETFHPRYGWLKKAYDQISKRGDAFRTDDATVVKLINVHTNLYFKFK
ncbi:MAG: DUF4007 family protein [Cenarchaeum sp. SB0661_bin_35]|nr:DUF4007 family protein [Cenarchaeum sp. SB0667_bin_13]MYC78903.1 DUF4007 family protein [Cenarchaeum sp. SB0661_bin_35]